MYKTLVSLTRIKPQQLILAMGLMLIAVNASAHTAPSASSVMQHLAHVFGSAHHLFGGLLLLVAALAVYKLRELKRAKRARQSFER